MNIRNFKTKKENPFIDTSLCVSDETSHSQERNQLWWERKPMTYANWEANDRTPKTLENFLDVEKYMFANSPFFREEYDFSSKGGKTVLDIGCGTGGFSCCFAKMGAIVSSLDLTDAGVKLTALNAQLRKLNLSVVQADTENLPLQDSSFDYIFSWGVLHHTSNMAKAFFEVGRVLKSGGTGIIMVYHKNSIVYYLHGLFWLIFKGKLFSGETLSSVQRFYTDGFYHRYLREEEIIEMLINVGLTPVRCFSTQYQKKILPIIPRWLDKWLKARFGMCLVAEFKKR